VSIVEPRRIADESLEENSMRMIKDRYSKCEEPFCFAYDFKGKLPDMRCKYFSQMGGAKNCYREATDEHQITR